MKTYTRVDNGIGSRTTGSTAPTNEMIPLFIPLQTEFYQAFADGSKRDELRRYGPRWNERTCVVSRRVVLSHGYGKAHRLRGYVGWFKKQRGTTFGSTYRAIIERVFGTLDVDIACISIVLDAVDPVDGSSTS